MNNRRNYYRILHVQPDSPEAVIRSSYRTLMQKLRMHPDLGGDNCNAALLNEAFEVLIDPDQRARYDEARRIIPQHRGAVAVPPKPGRSAAATIDYCCAFCGAPHRYSKPADPDARCRRCDAPLSTVSQQRLESDGQRAVRRFRRRRPVELCLSWPADRRLAESRDLSLHGMQLATGFPLQPDTCVKIDCDILSAVARVAVCRAQPEGDSRLWLVGTEFITLRFEARSGSFVATRA